MYYKFWAAKIGIFRISQAIPPFFVLGQPEYTCIRPQINDWKPVFYRFSTDICGPNTGNLNCKHHLLPI
ncbi:MAG TPA: hypothetical protein DHV17_05745 [Chitinophagaceae bacterium]|nr:hypothetical protein [Chitinophagaceae bacterium]